MAIAPSACPELQLPFMWQSLPGCGRRSLVNKTWGCTSSSNSRSNSSALSLACLPEERTLQHTENFCTSILLKATSYYFRVRHPWAQATLYSYFSTLEKNLKTPCCSGTKRYVKELQFHKLSSGSWSSYRTSRSKREQMTVWRCRVVVTYVAAAWVSLCEIQIWT